MKLPLGLAAIALFLSTSCDSKKKFAGATQVGTSFKQVSDTKINFGDSNVFRIGDGTSGIQSACASELGGYDLKGTTYYFQFEVLEDDTAIDLTIGKLCGVDRDGKTTINLLKASDNSIAQAETGVPTDASGRSAAYLPYPQFTLAKGLYSLVVKSNNVNGGTGPAQPGVDEFDDFIIGSIEITGQKPVKAVKVYAE